MFPYPIFCCSYSNSAKFIKGCHKLKLGLRGSDRSCSLGMVNIFWSTYLLFTVWTHFSGNVLTALIFHFANLGVVGILLEVHRTGYVVVDPDTQKKGDHGSHIYIFWGDLSCTSGNYDYFSPDMQKRRSWITYHQFSEVAFPEPLFKAKKCWKESTPWVNSF